MNPNKNTVFKKILLVYCQLLLVCGCSWGQQIFQKRYEIPDVSSFNVASAIQITDTSFLVFTNYYKQSTQERRGLIICLDTSGAVLWNKTIDFKFNSATINLDSTISLIGYSDTNVYDIGFLKIDKDANVVSRFTWGSQLVDEPVRVIATSDTGNLLLGNYHWNVNASAPSYGFVIKINSLGAVSWIRHYGGYARTVISDALEETGIGYKIIGWTTQFSNDTIDYYLDDILLLDINYNGEITTANAVIEPGVDIGQRIFKKNNGEYLLGVTTDKYSGLTGLTKQTLLQVTPQLTQTWSTLYSTSGGIGVFQWEDLKLINDTAIFFDEPFTLVDSVGNLIFRRNPHGLYGCRGLVTLFDNDNFYSFGHSQNVGGSFLYFNFNKLSNSGISGCYENSFSSINSYPAQFSFQTVQFSDSLLVDSVNYETSVRDSLQLISYTDCSGYVNLFNNVYNLEEIRVFPNPVEDMLNVESINSVSLLEIELLDVLGKQIINTKTISQSTSIFRLNISSINSGIYFLRVMNKDNNSQIFKIIKK